MLKKINLIFVLLTLITLVFASTAYCDVLEKLNGTWTGDGKRTSSSVYMFVDTKNEIFMIYLSQDRPTGLNKFYEVISQDANSVSLDIDDTIYKITYTREKNSIGDPSLGGSSGPWEIISHAKVEIEGFQTLFFTRDDGMAIK